MPNTYAKAGVDYGLLDPFKAEAMQAAATTKENIKVHGCREVGESRGESAYLVETPWGFLAHTEEGLGTKNLIADAMYNLTGYPVFYFNIGIDAAACVLNDLITSGAIPLDIMMHLAAGSSKWFKNRNRLIYLLSGWTAACHTADVVWGGGETSTLTGVIKEESFMLSGSATGVITPKIRKVSGNIQVGDRIVMLDSSGLHANGATLVRRLAENIPNGYLEKLPSGKTLGEAALAPTIIYAPVVKKLIQNWIIPSYMINITGHGWRKLMRNPKPFTYVVYNLPIPHEIFTFVAEKLEMSEEESYETFNMGAGFTIFVRPDQVDGVISAANSCTINAFEAGRVDESLDGKKRVILPNGVVYKGG